MKSLISLSEGIVFRPGYALTSKGRTKIRELAQIKPTSCYLTLFSFSNSAGLMAVSADLAIFCRAEQKFAVF
jgi:hypothetical protein